MALTKLVAGSGAVVASSGPPARTITYSVQARGTFASSVTEFGTVADSILNDPRGWSLGGSVRYLRVSSGGNFRLWLVSDPLVAGFGGPCTAYYSCQAGTDIVINENRWRLGSKH